MEMILQHKMPLFTNKFSPKQIPTRTTDTNIVSRELGPEYASKELGLSIPTIKLNLSGHEYIFEDGEWTPGENSSKFLQKEDSKTRKSQLALEEEYNLLKLKFEILLDMHTQTTAELQLKLKEIEYLKQEKRNR